MLTNSDAWWFAPNGHAVLTVDEHQGRIVRRTGTDFQESQAWIDVDTNTSNWVVSKDFAVLGVVKTNGLIELWDLERRELLRQLTISNGNSSLVAILSNGTQLVSGRWDDRQFEKWDVLTSNLMQSWRASGKADRGILSLDGQWYFSWRMFGEVNLLVDIRAGRETSLNLRDIHPVAAAFSDDARLLAIASDFGYLTLWETSTLREAAKFSGFLLRASSVAFSPNGERLAAGSNGKEAVKLWDVESHLELLTLEGKGSLFWRTIFSPDGNMLGSINSQGVLHLWRAPSMEQIAAFEAKEKAEAPRP